MKNTSPSNFNSFLFSFILIVFLYYPSFLIAQDSEGYIILNSGDTINVSFKYHEDEVTKYFEYRDQNNKKRKIFARDAKEIFMINGGFKEKFMSINTKDGTFRNSAYDFYEIFMKILIDGEIKLMQLGNGSVENYSYTRTDGTTSSFNYYSDFPPHSVLIKNGAQVFIQNTKEYNHFAPDLFKECETMKDKLNLEKINSLTVLSAVKEYNECMKSK